MHGYYTNPKRLREWLKDFANGQFCLQTKYGETLRGEVDSIVVSDDGGSQSVRVKLRWICRKNMVFDQHGVLGEKWFQEKISATGLYIINVKYTWYYFQTNKRRVKIKTDIGEQCWFYMLDDPTHLEPNNGDGFTSKQSHLHHEETPDTAS